MERELGRHDVTFQGSRQGFEARVCAAPLAELALFHVSFGKVSFELASRDVAKDTFVFGVVTSGSGTIDQGRGAAQMAADQAYMRDMRRPVVAQQSDFGSFALNVPLERLRAQAEALFGPGAAEVDLRFQAAADLRSAAGANLEIETAKTLSLQPRLGIGVASKLYLGEGLALTPRGQALWLGQLGDTETEASARFAGTAAGWQIPALEEPTHSAALSLGADLTSDAGWVLSAGYAGRFGEGARDHGVLLGGRISF